MRGDIISRRQEGAATHFQGVSPLMRLAIVGTSYGRRSVRPVGLASDNTLASTDFFIRGIQNIVADPTNKPNLIYYPNVHFLVRMGGVSQPIMDPNNLDTTDPSQVYFDWSIAPYLSIPKIESVEVEAGAGSLAAGNYTVAIQFLDKNTNGTLVTVYGQVSVGAANSAIKIKFVPEPYAYQYRVWVLSDAFTNPTQWYTADLDPYQVAAPSPAGWSSDDYGMNFIRITSESLLTATANDPDTYNTNTGHVAKAILHDSTVAQANTIEMDFTEVSSVQEFFSAEDVAEAHGAGSEVANIAKIAFSQGVRSVVVSAVPAFTGSPSSPTAPTVNDFMSAIDRLDAWDITFFGTTLLDNTLLQYGISKAEVLSDKVNGQKERYFLYALKGDWAVSDLEAALNTAHSSASQGKRVVLAAVDGGKVYVSQWRNLDGSTSTDTAVLSSINNADITPMVLLFAAIAKYIATGDPAEPLTNKYIQNFRLPGDKNPDLVKRYTEQGVMFFTSVDKYSAPYVDTGVLPSIIVSVEDGELSIAVTEDVLDKEIRRFLANWRGKKALASRLESIKFQLIQGILSEFKSREWIEDFDKSSVQIWMDPDNPTRLRGSFMYKPVYPINQLWIEHTFIV